MRFSILFATEWGALDDEGIYLDEATHGGRTLAETNRPEAAEALANAYACGLAHYHYGNGKVVVTDALLGHRHVGLIREAEPLLTRAVA